MVQDGGAEPARPAAPGRAGGPPPHPDPSPDPVPPPGPDRSPHPVLQPVATDDRRAVAVGTAVWLAALVACLVGLDGLRGRGDGWWVGVCVAGVLLGLAGLVHLQRRHVARRVRERRAARSGTPRPPA